ncbi:hypothetical protein V6N11_081085 [Hibiscus sabdariffa]|uniref:Reverse transcriptase zinc-binding domain-containing protein n=1 Tax=Hibiscus sabdariffa TaxID=183260 RepID=A0ABR2QJA9_9ROSI
MKLTGSNWPPKQAIWKAIWRLNVPQRIRLFLWIAFQQKLMTNATRHYRHLAPSPTCPLCNSQPEMIIHALHATLWFNTSGYRFFLQPSHIPS